MPRNRTPVVTGRPDPSGKKFGIVAFATVNGFQGLMSGTLIPLGLKFTVKPGFLNGSGVNGTAAREESKNDRGKERAGHQAKASHAARESAAADVVTSEGNEEGIRRNVAVPAKNPVETLVEVGDDYDIGFIVASACFDPCLPLAHLVRGPQIGIPIAAANFQTTEFVD